MMGKIICVTDNAAATGSRLKTEHGVAFWITTDSGNVLFDTGASAETLAANLDQLGLPIAEIDAMAFSHSHYDHTGGIEAILSEKAGIPIYANADIFRPKYSKHDGNYDASGFARQQDDYTRRADWHMNDALTEIVDDLWTTGRIVEREFPEGRSAGHFIRMEGDFVPDPYLDDMSLVLKTAQGLVLICGCCHAGILNTLAHVRSHFEGEIVSVIGGIHLMVAEKPMIDKVINTLREIAPNARYWLNHCTGNDAQKAFAAAFGDQAHHFKAGESILF